MLNLENLNSTDLLSLGFELLGLIISLFEFAGGNEMECTNIVVGIGFTMGGNQTIGGRKVQKEQYQKMNLTASREVRKKGSCNMNFKLQ